MDNVAEQWKDIPGFNGTYQVSNLGNVRSVRQGNTRLLKPFVHQRGHLGVQLFGDGFNRKFMVGKLVAEAFIPPVENKPRVKHINGDKGDNRVGNLVWANQSEIASHHTGSHEKHSAEWNAKISAAHRGLLKDSHWFNDGNTNVRSRECPVGFKPGRLIKK